MVACWFHYIATKGSLPVDIQKVKSGYIHAKNSKVAEKRLRKDYRYVMIMYKIPILKVDKNE